MNTTRKWQTSIAAGLIALALLQFQNCGPIPNHLATDLRSQDPNQVNQSASGHADNSRIDDVKKTQGLTIPQADYKLSVDQNQLIVLGLCNSQQSGAILSWQLTRESDELEVLRGQAECRETIFRIQLENLESVPCETHLKLKAQLGLGGLATTQIYRACD